MVDSPRHPKVVQLAEQLGRAQKLGQEKENVEAALNPGHGAGDPTGAASFEAFAAAEPV